MENTLIIDPNEKRLVDPAFDKYMDASATRRELQSMINHFAKHLDALYATLDTQHIVLNFIAEEKLNVTKDELLVYVEKKRQEMQELAKKKATCKHGKTKQQECSECRGGFDGASPQIVEDNSERTN